jgi:hypothetical protein
MEFIKLISQNSNYFFGFLVTLLVCLQFIVQMTSVIVKGINNKSAARELTHETPKLNDK